MSESRTSTPPRRGLWRVRNLVVAAIGAAALFAVWLLGVGGSYALWQDSATVDAGTITTGTAELTAQWLPEHSDAAWSNLLPGESVRQPFTLHNTGSAALEVAATASVAAPSFEVRVTTGTCPTAPLSSVPVNATPQPVAALAAGDTLTACLEVRATAAATPVQSAQFAVQFDGQQGPS